MSAVLCDSCGFERVNGYCLALSRGCEVSVLDLATLWPTGSKQALALEYFVQLALRGRFGDGRALLDRSGIAPEDLLLVAAGGNAFDRARQPRGPFIQTFTGRLFYPAHPDPAVISPVDIAHALSLINRFAGHTRFPYSVAAHSMLVTELVMLHEGKDSFARDIVRHAILHDAAEAYMVDLPQPVKVLIPTYASIEHATQRAIWQRFNLAPLDDYGRAVIKEADRIALAIERRDLKEPFGPDGMPPDEVGYREKANATPFSVKDIDWRRVKRQFLETMEVAGLQ